ncbi:hypothetical protein FQA39_LY13875 [Lamprigera yunnana]|nr:hypothetical protein FQA39_LY13875 [Lamprigera yunnana]
MWMLYAEQHWTKAIDLKLAVERLYENLGTLEFDADHEAIYGMEKYYTVEQCEQLQDKYKIGRKWLRRLIRKHTKPIAPFQAALWKQRVSIAYALFAWTAFGYVIYNVVNGKSDWGKYYNLKSEEELLQTPAQQWTKTLGIKKATVYRISGFNYYKYEIDNESEEEKK